MADIAGNQCDGQVLVTADLLGLSASQPPVAKAYVDLTQIITDAVGDFSREVRDRTCPPESR